jgi:uroporphyrinogen decarboxylase
VPLQFDLSRPLLEAFSQKLDIPIGWQPNYYEDLKYRTSGNEIRVAMGSDCVLVGGGVPAGYEPEETDDGCIINEFGMKMKMGIAWYDVVEGPLEQATTVQQVRDLPFPDPADPARYEDAARYIDQYGGDYFTIGDVELTMFEMAWHMTGLQKFMTDMAMGEDYVEALIDRTMEWSIAVGKRLVEQGVDGIWTGDDFGAQNGMMISPDMWRKIFKPRMAEVFQEFRSVNPDVVVMYHCDGAIAPIIGDLIEIGLDVFNPVQPGVPGHEPAELKAQFGSELSFWGAIDQQQLLPLGTPTEIDADVKAKIEALGPGGGYMVAPAHILQGDTPVENVEAFIEAVKQHGVYT